MSKKRKRSKSPPDVYLTIIDSGQLAVFVNGSLRGRVVVSRVYEGREVPSEMVAWAPVEACGKRHEPRSLVEAVRLLAKQGCEEVDEGWVDVYGAKWS